MGFSRQNTRVCCHFLLQEIFPTQGSNAHLLHLMLCWLILYRLSRQGQAVQPKGHCPWLCGSEMTQTVTGRDNIQSAWSGGMSTHVCRKGLFIEVLLCAFQGYHSKHNKTDALMGLTLAQQMAIKEIPQGRVSVHFLRAITKNHRLSGLKQQRLC